LSIAFPSQGGTVEFLNQAFGEGLLAGTLNVLLWLSYIVMLSLYSYAFGSYGKTFFPEAWQPVARHALISGSIVAVTVLNAVGAKAVGEAEEWVVGLKIAILSTFIAVGVRGIDMSSMAPANWPEPISLVAGGMIVFLAYEGFELIANTAGDVRDKEKTLPRAFYCSVAFVILLYVMISATAVGNLPYDKIVAARDYALAAAAKPFMGDFGYTLISVAALLSTASAINATLYGATRVSFIIAKEGELPAILEKKVWNRPIEGLLITSAATLFAANFFDLSSISTMGSAGFLFIFLAVNAANLRLHRKTGGNRIVSVAGAMSCLCAFAALIWRTASDSPRRLWILACMVLLSLVVESAYRLYRVKTKWAPSEKFL
jgi:amino acid transporter